MRQLPLQFSAGRVPRVARLAEVREKPEEFRAAGTPTSAASHWEGFLSTRLARRVRLVVTNNRSTMVSFREAHAHLLVRVQRVFLAAGESEWEALARYIHRGDRRAGRVLDAYIARQEVLSDRPPPALRSRGRFFDLQAIFVELNERYFHGACRARIGWGSAGARRYRRTIQLGCFVQSERLIRIHPSLDQAFVPRDYVAWIVFHEMLHEVFGAEHKGGRRCLHPPEFVALEQTFPAWQSCKRWERDNIHRLLRFRPGRP